MTRIAQKLEPSPTEILAKLQEINTKIDQLVVAAKEGGGLVPQIDFKRLSKWRRRLKKRDIIKNIKCKKQCEIGPCRYGAAQALKCYELFEKKIKVIKKRKFMTSHIPYTEKQLKEFRRKDLLMLSGILGINARRLLLKGKGKGAEPIIVAIIKQQPRWVKIYGKTQKEVQSKEPKVVEIGSKEDGEKEEKT